MSSSIDKVKFTALDSFCCKYSSMKLGYLRSNFFETVKQELSVRSENLLARSPIMHRGYFARCYAQKMAINSFLQQSHPYQKKQILFLGAGLDVSGLELLANYSDIAVYEVDYSDIMDQKFSIFCRKSIQDLLTECSVDRNSCTIHATENCSLSFISNDLSQSAELVSNLFRAGFDSSIATIIITECVLTYIEKDAVHELIENVGKVVDPSSVWFSYDMTGFDDRYGEMMFKNLTRSGFPIPGFVQFPSLGSQQSRFLARSDGDLVKAEDPVWMKCKTISMLDFYNDIIDKEERKRIEAIELFDEIEEWNVIMQHYCITVASKESDNPLLQIFTTKT